MVPAERIELPTFGLQNRCTTAVLRRHFRGKFVASAKRLSKNPTLIPVGWNFSRKISAPKLWG